MIALDMGAKHILLDQRLYSRILYPAFVYGLSLGNPNLIPIVLLLINYISVLLSSYILILILKKYSANLNLAYLWAFNVGYFICILGDLEAPLFFLLIILSLYFLEYRKYLFAVVFFSLALLTRETAILIIGATVLFHIIKKTWSASLAISISLIPFGVWQVYQFIQAGVAPFLSSSSQITLPFLGIIMYLLELNLHQPVRDLLFYLSPLPIVFFAFIQIYILHMEKAKRFTIYFMPLLFQLLFITMQSSRLLHGQLGNLGRYGIGMFLFSILFSVERKTKYNKWLMGILVFLSLLYFIERIIRFKVGYFVT